MLNLCKSKCGSHTAIDASRVTFHRTLPIFVLTTPEQPNSIGPLLQFPPFVQCLFFTPTASSAFADFMCSCDMMELIIHCSQVALWKWKWVLRIYYKRQTVVMELDWDYYICLQVNSNDKPYYTLWDIRTSRRAEEAIDCEYIAPRTGLAYIIEMVIQLVVVRNE